MVAMIIKKAAHAIPAAIPSVAATPMCEILGIISDVAREIITDLNPLERDAE